MRRSSAFWANHACLDVLTQRFARKCRTPGCGHLLRFHIDPTEDRFSLDRWGRGKCTCYPCECEQSD
ncbi:hypothetical protein [Mycolicibacterium sp.]|uniref:hypothetical protein n=1 Tax=Mycolicibacterium sp. TaxID=2320850 RepID=UPI0037C649A8